MRRRGPGLRVVSSSGHRYTGAVISAAVSIDALRAVLQQINHAGKILTKPTRKQALKDDAQEVRDTLGLDHVGGQLAHVCVAGNITLAAVLTVIYAEEVRFTCHLPMVHCTF